MSSASSSSAITIGLADDQHLVRAGFAMVLGSQPDIDVVWQASDGAEAVANAQANPVDIVLMDVQMPVLDGISATERLLSTGVTGPAGNPTRVVILTTFDSENYVLSAVEAGASGFLLKDTLPENLIADIRTAHTSEAIISPQQTARLLARASAHADVNEGLPDPLTPREQEILTLIARGKSNSEIAKELFISLPTVKTHVGRVLAKTSSRDRVHAVLFAFRRGLVTRGELLGY